MKKIMLLPMLLLLVLSGYGIAWSQGQMMHGYWYKANTPIDQLHKDYAQCMDKNETQCMNGKGYSWVTEGQNPGFWTKANTTIDQLHKDYAQCMDKNEKECMEAKGYKWTTEGRLRSY